VAQIKPLYFGVGGMAQALEHLPGKCEAVNSNPSTAKNQKQQQNIYFSHFYRLESPRSRHQQNQGLVRVPFGVHHLVGSLHDRKDKEAL
jgi:hypothetical protein